MGLNLNFRMLNNEKTLKLEEPFSLEEIKEAANLFGEFFVQDCSKGIVSKVKGDSRNGAGLIHSVKKEGSRGYLIFKLHFSKPYDCVWWDFLELVLFKMGFGVKWRGWMMECISTMREAVILNGSTTNEFRLYRGLQVNPKRIATWESIVDRVRKKLSSWMSRSLSWAGKVVLINVVLSSLSIFFMSLFNAPVTIIKKINKIRRNFLWGNTKGKNKMAKVDWNIVCKPKVKGGAGVVNLGVKNKALLAKWSWRFAFEKEALWRKVILVKYGSKVQRWHFKTTNPKDMSSVWKGIVENFKDVVMPKWMGVESFYWWIRNGRTVLFGIDIWCGLCRDDWNEFFTRSLLGREEVMRRELAERVSGMVLIPDMEDKLCWANDKNEEFLVKKCSELLILDRGVDINFACDKFWKLKVPPRVRSFLWLLTIDRIPSKDFLVKIGVNLHDISNQVDCFEDFFALCNKVKMVGISKSFWLILISTACWTIWLARNGLVFESRRVSMENLIFQSKMRALLWIRSIYNEVMLQDNFWWICLNKCRIDTIISNSAASFLRPTPHGWLKFNVCGVAKEDRAGYGG
ncbi:hypothetical protein Gotri_013968, partial [Gossypium trilobum]|nr:hypothetical protein [Gossypium trilobum]